MRPKVIKIFNYHFFLKEFLALFFCYLLMEPIFSWIFIQNSMIYLGYVKLFSLVLYGFMLFHFRTFRVVEKIYIGIFTAIIVKLAFESMFKYGTVFQYFEMYTVLFPVIFTIFIKSLLRRLDIDILEFIAKFYLLVYIVFMIIFGRGFSLGLSDIEMSDYGPFSGDTRIIHAGSVFMMIVPFLWYLNKYVTTRQNKFLIWFLFCFIIILLHQHRSVWSSTIVATFFYLLAILRNNKGAMSGFFQFFGIAIVLIAVSFIIISNTNPQILDYFSHRFSEILDPGQDDTTSSFRFQQSEVYSALGFDRPFFGWTFEGYELDNPLVDWWPAKTGQHFHQGYIEMFFYHGIVGLLLKYSFQVYILIRLFGKKLSEQSVILASFCVCSLAFSMSYILSLMFWGHVGMCLYYLERDKEHQFKSGIV